MLVSRAQLDFVRAKVRAGRQPLALWRGRVPAYIYRPVRRGAGVPRPVRDRHAGAVMTPTSADNPA
ncbi:hypothetical protein GCM10010166_50890 [Couchioplanes caeruleus subsp. azureus]|nr:hypothetical protein GCM10010166_50890 [Couchioplanes caeruleus subsp. azureus]